MAKEFYCRYGQHWTGMENKIHTARQGDFICTVCEEKRTKDWVKIRLFTNLKTDSQENYHDDED